MMPYLEKALNVRRQEFRPASLLFLYLFLAIGVYIMGQTVGDALFLSAFPTYLPQVIIATAFVVGVFTSSYIRLSNRLRLERLIVGSLLFFALGFAVFWSITRFSGRWAYPFIYIWVYMVGALVPAMGWTLANCCLTTREARRIFGFIGAGAILGAPCAGFLTAALTRHGAVKPETLLLVMATGLVVCALSVKLLFRQGHHRLTGFNQAPATVQGMPRNLRQVWAYIRGSRYLLLITALILVGCASTTVIGYQFKLIAYKSFSGDKVALAAFFGRFNGYIGLASFLLQMLLTGRLLRYFGIRVTLFVMPTVFLGGSVGLLLAPALLSASVLKGSQGMLRYSLDKSTTELLYLPVAPPAMKNQIKAFIDGFVWRMADGLAGITLFVFGNRMKFNPGRISLVNFVFLSGWIVIAYAVRREYMAVLRGAIEQRTLDPERTAAGVLDATSAEVLAHSLERRGEQQVLYGLSLFEVGRQPVWHPALCSLLEHPSAVVRQRALHLLVDAGHQRITPQVEKMLGDEAVEVRAEALRYLVVHMHKDPLELLQTPMEVPAHCLQSAIVIHLARSGESDYLPAARHILHAMLAVDGSEGLASRLEAARALGAIPAPSELHAELFKLLRDQNPVVVEQALLSAGRIRSGEFLPLVIEKLAEPRLLAAALTALADYGEAGVGALHDRLNDRATPTAVRKRIPQALARSGTASSAFALADSLIQSDPEIRYEIIKALNKLRARDPAVMPAEFDIANMFNYELIGYYRSFQILAALQMVSGKRASSPQTEPLIVKAVRERMEQEFERVFRILGLLHSPRDIHNAYLGLISLRPQLQANAMEVLEHLLAPDLYRRLISGVDPDSTAAERLVFARRLCHTSIDSQAEALRTLLQSGDRWLYACALYAAGRARLAELDNDVRQLIYEDPLLEETRNWASTRLAAVETAEGTGMLTVLEKVDLLRRASIFQEIPTPSLVRIAAIANELSWASHQTVYQEGHPADSIFFLLEGEVQLLRSGKTAQRRGESELIGILAALTGGTHTETAAASQSTRALEIDREDLFDALAEDFNVTRGIVKALAGMVNGGA